MREDEKDAYFRDCALSWIRKNPGRAAKLYALKVLNYFNFRNELATKSEASRLKDIVLFVTYYPLLIIAVIRLIVFRIFRISPFEGSLYLIYFGNAFALAIFFTRIRFRIPLDALLIVLASIFIGLLVRTMTGRRIRQIQRTLEARR